MEWLKRLWATPTSGADRVASETTVQRAGTTTDFAVRAMPKVTVKGKAEALQVYAVTAPPDFGAVPAAARL